MFYIFTLLSFTISICGQSLGQTTNEIIFSDNGATYNRVTTGCSCVAAGTCYQNSASVLDVRIVNQGGNNVNNCGSGEVLCCGGSGGLTDGNCGIRKITNSAAQPVGTARFGEYPWQAALLSKGNVYIGSGVLINANYVLTAAHKIVSYPNNDFKVRLGEWDGKQPTEANAHQEYTPVKVVTHPNFVNQNLQNDLAIIRLDRTVPIASSPNINTACLASAVPAPGTRCWVSGWGKNAFGPNGDYQSIQKEVDVPIVDQTSCENRLRSTRLGQYFILDRTSFMCAGGEAGKDACTGDGGSPLVCQTSTGQWEVVGLVAWGIGCAGSGVPGVYVNLSNYRSWIYQQLSG